MANTFSAFGLRPFGHQDGSAPTQGLSKWTIGSTDASVIGTGDLVAISTAATLVGNVTAISCSAGGVVTAGVVGVFAGCEYYNTNVGRVVWSSYFPGTGVSSQGTVTAYVIDDPQMQYIAQASTISVVGTSNIGMNIGVLSSLSTAVNTTTGISGIGLASSYINANSCMPFKVVNVYSAFAPPGVNGTSTTAGAILVVTPNFFTFQAGITGTS